MTRGNSRGKNNRGRGDHGVPRSRGGNRGKGRGFGRGKGRGDAPADLGVQVQVWPEDDGYGHDPRHRSVTPRGRGRGHRGYRGVAPASGRSTPRAFQTRGRGHAGIGSPTQAKQQARAKSGPNVPLSSLLYESRPLLRPIVFVRSTATPYLFQQEEELLKPAIEEVEDVEESQMPTADRVAQVFSGSITINSGSAGNDDEEELEEIDFNDTEKLSEVKTKPVKEPKTTVEEQSTRNYKQTTSSPLLPDTGSGEGNSYEDQSIALSSVDVMNAGIAGMSINSEPEVTFQPVQGIADVTMTTQETIKDDDDEVKGQILSAPTLKMSDDIVLQEKCDMELGVGTTVARGGTALERMVTSTPLPSAAGAALVTDADEQLTVEKELTGKIPEPREAAEATNFFIDTTPSRIFMAEQRLTEPTALQILGTPDTLGDDDEVIVYVAPHPRSGRTTPAITSSLIASSALPTTSILTGLSTINEITTTSALANVGENAGQRLTPPSTVASSSRSAATIPRQFVPPSPGSSSTQRKTKRRAHMYEAGLGRRRKGKRSMFSLGAARQEMEWQEYDGRDPKLDQRRRGDSDIDWGDEDEDEDEMAAAPASGADGMDVDPDLRDEKSMEAFGSFADGMLSQEGSRFVTLDDIADIERLRKEDEASVGGAEGSSGDDDSDEEEDDVDAVLEIEEERMIAEAGEIELSDNDEEDEEESDYDLSPCSSFRARLERMRKRPKKRADTSGEADTSQLLEDEDEDEDEFDENCTWEEYNEDFFAHLEDMLEENQDILAGRDRKEKKQLLKAISDGDFSTLTAAKRKGDKPKNLPLSLQKQWEKDRAKKAERRAARELAKLEAAVDPLGKKKGGKKGRKAMLAAARFEPKITIIGPNRVIDMTTLVQQIRRFLANPNGPQTMSLPPSNKYTRKLIHEMATAFNLKSKSNGVGDTRYTMLIRTSRSGLSVNERKVANIVRRSPGGGFYGGEGGNGEKSGKGKGKDYGSGSLRQKEGEEVGKAAPKIGSSNLGFKMLEAMGWSEGNRIGVSGGLDKPVTAIIKHSKLGLGATKQ
ncbi:hypothetical protein AX15_005783 [Amanita polypyramis BW_CC]|nr:hypothetical protein AX15_005783 [Amanita polypyramis BW_CC]